MRQGVNKKVGETLLISARPYPDSLVAKIVAIYFLYFYLIICYLIIISGKNSGFYKG